MFKKFIALISATLPLCHYAITLLFLIISMGCAHVPLSSKYTGPQSLPADIAAYYNYPSQSLKPFTVSVLLNQSDAATERLIRFPLIAPDFKPTEPVVEFEWFESHTSGKRPAIIFNPILGGDYYIERGLCRFFAKQGFHVALIHRKTLKISPEHPIDRVELLLRQGILRIRQVIDWISMQEGVDSKRLGSFGISMGGIAGAITAAVEPRLSAHVLALAGGPIADILMTSKDRMLKKPRKQYLSVNQMDAATLSQQLEYHIKTDPIRFSAYADANEILMFVALFDRTIGRNHTMNLWRSLGRPEIITLPTGHYSAFLFLPFLKRESLRFFRKHLG